MVAIASTVNCDISSFLFCLVAIDRYVAITIDIYAITINFLHDTYGMLLILFQNC